MERLLTLDEVSALLQVPVNTLRFWRSRGTGPKSLKVGGHVRYRPSDVQHYLNGLVAAQ